MQCTSPPSALPRRLRGTPTTSGLLLGPDLSHIAIARRWAAQATRTRPGLAEPLALAVSELTTNAMRHTASGLPGGTVRVEIDRTGHLELRVTDDGPRPDTATTPPAIPALDPFRVGGNGLRLVEAVCAYWDWTRNPDGGTAVRALFPR
ncbi:ATP-binding protein [Nocardiopsis sp. CNT312]|uniref:ATP-binding protein n=1 Tax=Nocardiopsis sp. CNT312 TaxID=1137268 RepID=UPI00048EAA72|nr:ATP-binding protein [Nocardiopsis sp. CNT312]